MVRRLKEEGWGRSMDNDGVSLDKAAPHGSSAGEDETGADRTFVRARAESIATRLYSSLTRDSQGTAGGSAEAGWDELRRELDRSRRYGRTFVLIAITQPPKGRRRGAGAAESVSLGSGPSFAAWTGPGLSGRPRICCFPSAPM